VSEQYEPVPAPKGEWRTEVLRERKAIAALEPAVVTLFDALPEANPFLSPEWIYSWITTLGRRFSLCFVLCYEGAELRGVWPFFEQPVPLLRPLLLPVAAQVADLFDPIADARAVEPLTRAVLGLSAEYWAVWIPLLSDRFVSPDVRAFLQKSTARVLLRRRTVRLQIELGRHRDFEAYAEATFAKRVQQGLRRKLRRLEQQGRVEFVACDAAADIEQELSSVVRLERASWKHARQSGIFKDPAHHAFYFLLLQMLAGKRRVRLSLLRVGGELAAFEIGVLGGGSYCMHAIAFHPKFAAFSPGRLLVLSVLEKCFAEGRLHYDFMQNDQEFKRELSNREESFWDCVLIRRGVAGWIISRVIHILDWWRSGRPPAIGSARE
jgi:CelD/BcsL family acetyltransferase involved in cellulose biosynthesis